MPFLFKYAIDALTADPTGHMLADMPMIQLLPATVLLGYGAARAGSSLCNELRNAVFAKVACTPELHPMTCQSHALLLIGSLRVNTAMLPLLLATMVVAQLPCHLGWVLTLR